MSSTLEELTLPEKLIATYELQKLSPTNENTVLNGFRELAINSFRKTGFPGKKNEEYKYLSFEKLLVPILTNAPQNDANSAIKHRLDADPKLNFPSYRAVLINGVFSPEVSSITHALPGLQIGSVAHAMITGNSKLLSTIGTLSHTESDPFLAINSALFADGLFIVIPDGAKLDLPIQIIQVSTGNKPAFIQPRLLVIAGKNSEAQIVQSSVSFDLSAQLFTNTVTEIQVEEGASLHWYSIQAESSSASQVNTTEAHIKSKGRFNAVTVTIGGGLVRNNLNCILDSSHSEAHLFGYYHPTEGQVFDNHTLMDHRYPNCESNELYKGVISGNGKAVFNGKVHVHPQAQKTNAFQSNKNILLSDDATINTKPQLEIYADDVKCSHGSSTGYLDPEQLFYLRSRGIAEDKARALLLHAYAGEILEQINIPVLQQTLKIQLENLFNNAH
jgi:Fe-S cluster assembly protein SufD